MLNVELHGDKKRERVEIDDVGKEAFIHWNGMVHLLSRLTGLEEKY